jgi:hypothetical protein
MTNRRLSDENGSVNSGWIRPTALVLGVLMASGCESPVASGPFSATFLTGANTYALVPASGGNAGAVETYIPFSYRNDSRAPIYVFLGCLAAPPTLEKKIGGSWEFAWRPPTINDCEPAPIVLAPNQSLNETIHVVAYPFGGDLQPQFAFEEIEGTYRLKWEEDAVVIAQDQEEYPYGPPIDVGSRVSNEFTLTVP